MQDATGASAPIAMRISFATEPTTKISEGVERLARALAAYRKGERRESAPQQRAA